MIESFFRNPTRMDFLVKKEQPIGLEDENDNDPLVMASCLDFKVAALKKKKKQKKMCFDHHELTDDRSSQILSMFRKYLYSKTQNDVVGKTNMEESEAIKLKHAARFTPRQASLLEQKLLRGIRYCSCFKKYFSKKRSLIKFGISLPHFKS